MVIYIELAEVGVTIKMTMPFFQTFSQPMLDSETDSVPVQKSLREEHSLGYIVSHLHFLFKGGECSRGLAERVSL